MAIETETEDDKILRLKKEVIAAMDAIGILRSMGLKVEVSLDDPSKPADKAKFNVSIWKSIS